MTFSRKGSAYIIVQNCHRIGTLSEQDDGQWRVRAYTGETHYAATRAQAMAAARHFL